VTAYGLCMKLRRALAAVTLPVLLLAACGDDEDGEDAAPTTTTAEGTSTTEAGDEVLDILVTNDDGYAAPGIDAVVEALRAMDDVTVTVVAPAGNQSGTADKTTPGELAVADVKTASGYEAKSVAGFPGDTVIVALDELGLEPDLVVSGTNIGQNIGPFSQVSGTVGAVKTAARRGIPGLAASTGTGDAPDFAESAQHVVEWVEEHREELLAEDVEPFVESINTPSCPGEDRGVVEVPLATDFAERDAFAVACDSTKAESALADDVDAFLNGYTSLTEIAF
jgi:5'-nucleotidase